MQETIRIICSLNWKIYVFLVKNIERTFKAKRFSQLIPERSLDNKTARRFRALGVLALKKPRSISVLNFLVPRSIKTPPFKYKNSNSFKYSSE